VNKLIVEGKIVNVDGEQDGQILIDQDSGLIESVGQNLGTADIKTPGLIFPGFVDVHVHAREDVSGSQNYKEDFQSMSEAAINGGVVTVADMPNNTVPPIDSESYALKKTLTRSSLVDVVLYAGIRSGSIPLTTRVPYKVFLGPSIGDLFFTSLAEVEETVKNYQGQFVSFHCEDPEILQFSQNEPVHEARRPREAEISAIKFAIMLIEKYEIQGKICHLTTREGLEMIREAKLRGLPVTAEVTPHHLYFDDSTPLVMNPPLRAEADRLALIGGLRDGVIDYLASDHAPHTMEEKEAGAAGLPHLDTYGLFAGWLMKTYDFLPMQIAKVCSYNPGLFLSQFTVNKFGKIAAGYVGSLAILDFSLGITVQKTDLKTKVGWSPFEGVTFPGRITHTIVRGKVYGKN